MSQMNPKEVLHKTATQFNYLTQPVTLFKGNEFIPENVYNYQKLADQISLKQQVYEIGDYENEQNTSNIIPIFKITNLNNTINICNMLYVYQCV